MTRLEHLRFLGEPSWILGEQAKHWQVRRTEPFGHEACTYDMYAVQKQLLSWCRAGEKNWTLPSWVNKMTIAWSCWQQSDELTEWRHNRVKFCLLAWSCWIEDISLALAKSHLLHSWGPIRVSRDSPSVVFILRMLAGLHNAVISPKVSWDSVLLTRILTYVFFLLIEYCTSIAQFVTSDAPVLLQNLLTIIV